LFELAFFTFSMGTLLVPSCGLPPAAAVAAAAAEEDCDRGGGDGDRRRGGEGRLP
jgi:hypothetical protein